MSMNGHPRDIEPAQSRQWAVRINIDLAGPTAAALLNRLALVERRIDSLRVSRRADLAEIVGALEKLAERIGGFRT